MRAASAWLGRLPASWRLARLGDVARLVNGFPFESEFFNRESGRRLVRIRDLTSDDDVTYYAGPSGQNAAVANGDVLVGMDGDFEIVRWTRGPALLNQRVCCLSARDGLDLRFLFYVLPSPLKIINDLTYFTTVKHLSSPDILKIQVPFPPLPTQRAIASFLDKKTKAIDDLIQKKERLIELLAEKRQALITQAVTKGLDPSVPMKDSGVEWLGKVPRHWEVKRLKHVVRYRSDAIKTGPFGSHLTAADMLGGDVKVYNQRTVLDRDFTGGDNYITAEKFMGLRGFAVEAEDVLLTTRGTIGRTAIVPPDAQQGILHPCLMRVQTNQRVLLPSYLSMLIEDCPFVSEQLRILSNATTIEVIYSYNLKEIRLPVPPVTEQREIIRSVAKIETLLGELKQAAERQVLVLGEYRQALISAAVTGQIDVEREAA